MAGERTRKVTLDPGASTDTPVRVQGRGGSLPGPDAGHPMHSAGGHGQVLEQGHTPGPSRSRVRPQAWPDRRPPNLYSLNLSKRDKTLYDRLFC